VLNFVVRAAVPNLTIAGYFVMQLQCPHCHKMLSVPEEFAGQMMKCPLCGGTFPTPSLPGAPLGGFNPAPPAPPAPVLPEPYGLAPSAAPTPPPTDRPKLAPLPDLPASTHPDAPAPPRKKDRPPRNDEAEPKQRKLAPPEPATPGEYKHIFSFGFDIGILTWLPPGLLTVVFLLSFFPWAADSVGSQNLWECAFSAPMVRFVFYVILFLLAWALSIASVVFNARLAPEPPFLQQLGPWRHAIAGGLSLLSFLFLAIAYIEWVFLMPSPMTVWMRIAIRFHLLAVLFAALELWLDSRRKRREPPPRVEVRW
jgi:hypothetical protein